MLAANFDDRPPGEENRATSAGTELGVELTPEPRGVLAGSGDVGMLGNGA